jgi:Tfp pilus assembly protein PilF
LAVLFAAAVRLPAQTYLSAPFASRSPDAQIEWIGESVSETIRESMVAFRVPVVSRETRIEATKKLSLRSSGPLSLAALIKISQGSAAARLIHGEVQFTPAPPAPPVAPAEAGQPLANISDPPQPIGPKPPDVPPPSRGTLRLTARILEVGRAAQLAEFTESGPLEDITTVESNLAWRVLKFAAPNTFTVTRRDFRKRRPAVKLVALESYVRGLMAPTAQAQHRYFTQAARLDSTFSHPCYYLGRMHYDNENYREAAQWLSRVTEESPYFVHAQFMLGLSRFELSDFDAARRAFEAVVPRLPTPELWNNLAAAQARLNMPEAADNFRRALDSAPEDPDYHFNVGFMLWKKADFAAAAQQFRATLDRSADDEDAIYLLGRCLKQSGPRAGDLRTEGLERLKDSYDLPAPGSSR